MSKCIDCQYATKYQTNVCCSLTSYVMSSHKEHDCNCFNLDLSKYDICYNCKYYIGGTDWGLFCSHDDMYNHLGKFNDEPCERYIKKDEVKE